MIELHTGAYCDLHAEGNISARDSELQKLTEMSSLARSLGLEVHAGHGLTYDTVSPDCAVARGDRAEYWSFYYWRGDFQGPDSCDCRDATLDG